MGCDHLDKHTFDTSMDNINSNNNFIKQAFDVMLAPALDQIRDAWQSKKGWEKTNTLGKSLAEALGAAEESLYKNYNIMKTSGEEYARSQWMLLIIGFMTKYSFTAAHPEFAEDREIIIDDGKLAKGKESLNNALTVIYRFLTTMKDQTSSDQRFGYYSDGGTNPRAEMNTALSSVQESINTAMDKFANTFAEDVQADKTERDTARDVNLETFDYGG